MQYVIDALTLGSVYVLFALGLSLSWGTLNLLNLAHGAIFMVGAFVAYLVAVNWDLPFFVVIALASVGAGVLAVGVDVVAYRPLRRGLGNLEQMKFSLMVASVGAVSVIVTIVERLTTSGARQIPSTLLTEHTYRVAGVRVTNLDIVVVSTAVALTIALQLWVTRTKHGRALRGLADDPEACALLGVNQNLLSSLTMFVSGVLAGAAGVLLAMKYNGVVYSMGDPLLLKAFAIMVLAGIGSLPGTVVAGLGLAAAETIVTFLGYSSLQEMIAFGLILVILIAKPTGLFSRGTAVRS